MSACCRNNSWAQTILDGLPATASRTTSNCRDNSWAKTILDGLPEGCQHISHATTQLSLMGAVGDSLLILKSHVTGVDCGYIEPGSFIFSVTNPGAIAVVTAVTCTHYVAIIVSLASIASAGITQEQQDAINALVAATTYDSFGDMKTKYNALLSTLKAVFAGGA